MGGASECCGGRRTVACWRSSQASTVTLQAKGNKKEIYDLARKSYLVAKENPNAGTHDMIHTENFVLVDKEKRIRGYYDGTNINEINLLLSDINLLIKSYQKN